MDNSNLTKTLVFDPITFKGGSKIATVEALSLCRADINQFVIVTADVDYWKSTKLVASHSVDIVALPLIKPLAKQHYGLLYWLNQCYIAFCLLFILVKYKGIERAIGASGPGMDMALYIVKCLKNIEIVQFIHGHIGNSRSIGYCLTVADNVFYLPSCRPSISSALSTYLESKTSIKDSGSVVKMYLMSPKYHTFVNGLPVDKWPTRCQIDFPVCFWAASLLKWKGLDLFVEALKHAATIKPIASNICYIRPVDTAIPTSTAPVVLKHTNWYQDPQELDTIRSQSNIFVSTSHQEPFGLSILEALAAGMCVVIPQDGSYWDEQLTHNFNCIKYVAGDAASLSDALIYAVKNRDIFKRCIDNGLEIAQEYRAEQHYFDFVKIIDPNPYIKLSRDPNPQSH
ncbi:glycosyltransferase family 4 protein [Vibrio sp. T11.5]|uniref:glycosyltransferase family 4 protein n=1 Tax=Vibrio sp. T11.5 TaxID=2998836 RepID=UPI0022CD55DB|nr:glycosyltransferase family 4 protein [Vibrio sp. T11.5]MDA0116541.1 glycosyltransferase family 4 protein [Vibrio sp. T11.5]